MTKYNESDYIEFGDTGLVPLPDGWFLDTSTGYTITPEGVVYDTEGNIFYDPFEQDEYESTTTEEYDWYS